MYLPIPTPGVSSGDLPLAQFSIAMRDITGSALAAAPRFRMSWDTGTRLAGAKGLRLGGESCNRWETCAALGGFGPPTVTVATSIPASDEDESELDDDVL